MSAALQLPTIWGAGSAPAERGEERRNWKSPATRPSLNRPESPAEHLPVSVAFYRKHTESMLRRYLYASMQIGRAPSILSDSVGRGWASSRPIRTFEDAVIFVLDMERCLNRLGSLERQILGRIVLQEYTHAETATLLGMSVRTVNYKFPDALDRLTEKLLETGLLILPH
jgi:hypothetical protein